MSDSIKEASRLVPSIDEESVSLKGWLSKNVWTAFLAYHNEMVCKYLVDDDTRLLSVKILYALIPFHQNM